jgi:hypothetical protein
MDNDYEIQLYEWKTKYAIGIASILLAAIIFFKKYPIRKDIR